MPWMAWGPYIWADGTNPNPDGLTYACSDLQDDGTHPSRAGQEKIAQMLLAFFKSDTTTRPWFVAGASPPASPPVATAIMNAAGFFASVAPGSIATIFSSNLAGHTVAATGLPLRYGTAGAIVLVGGEPAPLYFVSPTQINLVVPAAGKDGSVVVMRDGVASPPISAQLALFTMGLFTVSTDGSVAAQHIDGTLITPENPAKRGETIAVYGTGKGLRNPAILAPEPLPQVTIGGVSADVQYFGPAPAFPGLDQINVTVPMSVPAGGLTPLKIQIGGFSSNTGYLAVSH